MYHVLMAVPAPFLNPFVFPFSVGQESSPVHAGRDEIPMTAYAGIFKQIIALALKFRIPVYCRWISQIMNDDVAQSRICLVCIMAYPAWWQVAVHAVGNKTDGIDGVERHLPRVDLPLHFVASPAEFVCAREAEAEVGESDEEKGRQKSQKKNSDEFPVFQNFL